MAVGHFGAQYGLFSLNQGLSVLYISKATITYLVQVLHSNVGGLLIALGDPELVNAMIQQLLSFFQQGASQDNYSCDSISNSIIL